MLLPATLTALCLFGVVTTGQGPLSPSGTISALVNSGDYVGAQARAERLVAAAPSPAERDISQPDSARRAAAERPRM